MTTFMPSITIPQSFFMSPEASTLLPIAVGTALGYSMRPTETQKTYSNLKQPPLHPPGWVFGPVWTALYGIMGYAAHRATFAGLSPFNSRATITKARHGMTLYSIQLALNLAWMPLFFGLKRPILATIDILGLIGVNGYLTYLWSTIDETAAYLQAPYMAWLGFATYLCVGSGYLNNWDLSEETPAKRSDRPPRRSERTERTERNDRSERSDRAERGDRAERRRK